MNHTNTHSRLHTLTAPPARCRDPWKSLAAFAYLLVLIVATTINPAWAALSTVSPTQISINVAAGGIYSFSVTGSVGEAVSTQSLFCSNVSVIVPANGIIFPAAGGCTSSSVTPINPVAVAGTLYSFTGSVTAAQAATMLAEAAAAGQPAGNRFMYWRQGFGASGFAIVRVNLIEPVSAPPTLLPANINFGNVQVGQTSPPQSVTFSTGTSTTNPPLNISHPAFTVATTTCPNFVTSNLSCQVTMSCVPSSAGALTGPVSVTVGTFTASSTVTCTGVAAPPPPAAFPTLSPTSKDFGSITAGATSAPALFMLLNPGASALSVTMSVPPGFTRLNPSFCATIPANSSCGIQIIFSPTAAQSYSGVFTVIAGATSLSSSVTGVGTAVPPPLPTATPSLLPAVANFGAVTVGAPAVTQIFTLSNPGSSALTGLVISAPIAFNQSSNCGVVLAASTSCQITVGFAPPAAQAYNGILSVTAGTTNLGSNVSGLGTAAPIVGTALTLTDVSPKRMIGNVSSDLTQVLSYTFSGNTPNVSPLDGVFCFDLIAGLPAGNTTTGNPCTSSSQFARHPTVSGSFQSTRVGNFIRSVRETIRVPSAVSRFARENGRSRYFFARQFSPNQYAVVAIELLGNVANQPIALTDMRMYFKQGGEQPIVFVKRGDNLPTVEAKISFTGSGWLRGAWEVVQPGDTEPTETDLMTDASLPLGQRGLQRRYMVVGTFQQYLPAVGQVTLTPPDMSRFPARTDGPYRVLLRLFADPAIGAESDGRLASGTAAFALPTSRYFVGSFASHGTTSMLPSISVSLPSVDHVFAATESVSFRWQATRDSAVYLLEAVDAAGKLVAAAQVPGSTVELNAGYSAPPPWRARASLGTGAVRWRVTAFSRDGEALARSEWRGVRF